MFALFIRNLFFTILQPGFVAGLIPYWIVHKKLNVLFSTPFEAYHYAGIFIFFVGWCIILYCIYRFAVEGHGTLSPADPTKNLVVKGIYQYSRNPMYIGVMLALLGEVIFSMSLSLLIYSAVIFIIFNLFIIFVEEPRLRRDFGESYLDYCKHVKRWI